MSRRESSYVEPFVPSSLLVRILERLGLRRAKIHHGWAARRRALEPERSKRGRCRGAAVVSGVSRVLIDAEVAGDLVDGETGTELAGGVLVGEEARAPQRLLAGRGLFPRDRDDPLAAVLTVRLCAGWGGSVGAFQGQVSHRSAVTVNGENGVLEGLRLAGDGADAHVSHLGDVGEHPRSDRQGPERAGEPLPAAGRYESVAESVVPTPATGLIAEGHIPVDPVPRLLFPASFRSG